MPNISFHSSSDENFLHFLRDISIVRKTTPGISLHSPYPRKYIFILGIRIELLLEHLLQFHLLSRFLQKTIQLDLIIQPFIFFCKSDSKNEERSVYCFLYFYIVSRNNGLRFKLSNSFVFAIIKRFRFHFSLVIFPVNTTHHMQAAILT